MCRLCETRKKIERADRVIRALEGGSTISPEAIAALMKELRNDLVLYHNDAAFQQQALQSVAAIVAEIEAAETGDDAPEAGATHCNPGTIN